MLSVFKSRSRQQDMTHFIKNPCLINICMCAEEGYSRIYVQCLILTNVDQYCITKPRPLGGVYSFFFFFFLEKRHFFKRCIGYDAIRTCNFVYNPFNKVDRSYNMAQ